MGHTQWKHMELFALEYGKIVQFDFVYTLASTNNNQSAPDSVKMYVTIRSWKSSIMNLIGREWSELSALYLKKLLYLTLFKLYHLQT